MRQKKRAGSQSESNNHIQPHSVKQKAPTSSFTDDPTDQLSKGQGQNPADIWGHRPPLRDGASQIRLLTVADDPNETQKSLRFSLSVQNLKNPPNFIAISYTWGDPSHSRHIFIEDQRCRVNKNCYDALQQACAKRPVGCEAIWIDSICINQQDNKEKSIQVAIMGEIYAKATHVFACVGPHSGDSEYLVQKALEVSSFELCTHEDYLCAACVVPWEQWILSLGLQNVSRLCAACTVFGERQYWTRIWIIQETAKAKSLSILCGDDILPWRNAHNLDEFLSLELDEIDNLMDKWEQLPSCETGAMHNVFKARKDVVQIDNVFSLYSESGCADPRDHFYGLLSLIQWPKDVLPIIPDYAKTTFDLAVELQPHLGFDSTPDMLRAFKISSGDRAVKAALHRRDQRSSSKSNSGAANDSKLVSVRTSDEACMCAWIWNDKEGNMTATLVKTGKFAQGNLPDSSSSSSKSPSDESSPDDDDCMESEQFIDRTNSLLSTVPTTIQPKKLMLGPKMVGIVCNGAIEGDLLVPFSAEDGQLLLVLRRVLDEDFEIIGQAVLLPDYDIGFFRKGLEDHETELGLTTARVEIKLDAEDVVVLFAQDMSGSQDLYDEDARCQRVFARATREPRGKARVSRQSRIRVRDLEGEDKDLRRWGPFTSFMNASKQGFGS